MTDDEIKIVNDAIANPNLEYYGSFPFESLGTILGNDAFTNTLLRKGFLDLTLIPMTGGPGRTHSICTLNQRWRDLKTCGNYSALIIFEREEENKERKRKIDADLFVQYQKENAKWQKTNNPLIEQANKSTIETNRISKTTNKLIAVFTFAAAIWYLRDIGKGILLDFYPKDDLHLDKLNPSAAKFLDIVTLLIFLVGLVAFRSIFLKPPQANSTE